MYNITLKLISQLNTTRKQSKRIGQNATKKDKDMELFQKVEETWKIE